MLSTASSFSWPTNAHTNMKKIDHTLYAITQTYICTHQLRPMYPRTCIHMRKHRHIHARTYTYICIDTHTFTCMNTNRLTPTIVHRDLHINACTYYICQLSYICMNTNMTNQEQTCTDSHTQTHSHAYPGTHAQWFTYEKLLIIDTIFLTIFIIDTKTIFYAWPVLFHHENELLNLLTDPIRNQQNKTTRKKKNGHVF